MNRQVVIPSPDRPLDGSSSAGARDRAIVRCREHVEIADLLLEHRRTEAAETMRLHLSTVSVEQVTVVLPSPSPATPDRSRKRR